MNGKKKGKMDKRTQRKRRKAGEKKTRSQLGWHLVPPPLQSNVLTVFQVSWSWQTVHAFTWCPLRMHGNERNVAGDDKFMNTLDNGNSLRDYQMEVMRLTMACTFCFLDVFLIKKNWDVLFWLSLKWLISNIFCESGNEQSSTLNKVWSFPSSLGGLSFHWREELNHSMPKVIQKIGGKKQPGGHMSWFR